MNITQIKKTINYLLDNNLKLKDNGLDKLTIHLQGPAGCAKTSIVKEIAQERGAGYRRIELASLEEVGD